MLNNLENPRRKKKEIRRQCMLNKEHVILQHLTDEQALVWLKLKFIPCALPIHLVLIPDLS